MDMRVIKRQRVLVWVMRLVFGGPMLYMLHSMLFRHEWRALGPFLGTLGGVMTVENAWRRFRARATVERNEEPHS